MKLTYGNILATYFLASESEIRQGIAWYDDAHMIANRIAGSYELASRTVAGVIAALSPSNKWERNIKDADNFCRVFAGGGDPLEIKVSTYGLNRTKALAILNGEDIDTILNGRKTVAFYHCIAGDDGHVCIDGHAYNIWMGERIPLDSIPSIGKGLYASIVSDYIRATTLINRVCQAEYTAPQVQAITWIAWRRMIGESEKNNGEKK